jgi:amidase
MAYPSFHPKPHAGAMTDLWRMSAIELSGLIRRREVSARDAAADALARLDAVNPAVNAVVEHRHGEALARADAIDAMIAQGDDPGVLAGVPITVKVNTDQAGFATTNGIMAQRGHMATANNPVVDNLLRAGAVVIGRTNTPAFSMRWFTSNQLHGRTRNPHDPSLTPGGSSGGAAAAVACGIGALAHGTDIAGSVRFPAYACGVHGLRPTVGRVAAWNASLPERTIGPQMSAVSGPLARSIADLGAMLVAMSARDARDPGWVPAPLDGPRAPKRAVLCLRPDGMETAPEVVGTLQDAARRLESAGWTVEETNAVPPMREAAEVQIAMWLGDGYEGMVAAADREGDAGASNLLSRLAGVAKGIDMDAYSRILTRRLTLARLWQQFLERTPVVLMPVSAELPFPDDLDLQGEAGFWRVYAAQMTQIALPALGLPGLSVAMGKIGRSPVGVQVVAARFREDLCLAAGAAIEAGMPVAAIDPAM